MKEVQTLMLQTSISTVISFTHSLSGISEVDHLLLKDSFLNHIVSTNESSLYIYR